MKWKTLLFTIVFLLSISLVTAGELNILQDTYYPGETFQALVSNTTITSSQISLLDNDSNAVAVSPLIGDTREDQYYVYFPLSNSLGEGTYTFLAGSEKGNFTMSTSPMSVQMKPAFVVLKKEEDKFIIQLINTGSATTVLISSSDNAISPWKSSVSLGLEETSNLNVKYEYNDIAGDAELSLSYSDRTFSVPLFYLEEVKEETNTTIENTTETNITLSNETEEVEALRFITDAEEALIEINEEETFGGYLDLENLLDETLTDLEFTLSGNLEEVITLNITEIETLEAEEIISQYIWVNQNNDSELGEYEGELTLFNELYSVSLPITVTISEAEIIEYECEIDSDCEEAYECTDNECVIKEEVEFDEVIFKESEEEKDSNGALLIGSILIIILLAFFILIYRQLKKGNEKQFNKYIEETKRR
tara:strand:- start:1627 stop:2892 length:1266 start_codon:yes stop_codon:yes gene_type:complete